MMEIMVMLLRVRNGLFLAILLFFMLSQAGAVEPDWRVYNELLGEYVSIGQRNGIDLNLVDYRGLLQDVRFEQVKRQLAKFAVNNLATQQEKLAFYINAYNVMAIKMVLDHWPLESIKDAGSLFNPVWKKTVGRIDGKEVSLHKIEHGILRKMGEPRIHMAIVCASVSCPDLRNEAYTATKLDQQLDQQTQKFLNNERKGLRIGAEEVHISKIFDWFEEDFTAQGGVDSFIKKYQATVATKNDFDADLPYDWSLNIK